MMHYPKPPSEVEPFMRPFVLLVVLAATSPAFGDEPANKFENLLPLAVGNSWTYRVSGQEDKFVVRVARQEMVGEQTCFRLDASLKDRVVASEHLAFTKDGLCRFRVDQADVFPPVCVLKQNPPKNGRWRSQPFQVGGRTASGSFTISNTEVTVPFRKDKIKTVTVDATVTEGTRPVMRTVVSYADGVGIVKQEINAGKTPLVLELEKFDKEENED
jgi:hypothetical protein